MAKIPRWLRFQEHPNVQLGDALALDWYGWMEKGKPWVGTMTPNDATDRCPSADSRWLQGTAPAKLAPNLFALLRFRNRSVAFELQDNGWLRPLRAISTPELVAEFVHLWTLLSSVVLSPGLVDTVSWRWTPDVRYSSKSAYELKFNGSFSSVPRLSTSTSPSWRCSTPAPSL